MLNNSFYRPLGRTGLKVSPICLGTDNFGNPTSVEESTEIINYAIESGINLIDTANTYASGESERIIGKALEHNRLRDDVILELEKRKIGKKEKRPPPPRLAFQGVASTTF